MSTPETKKSLFKKMFGCGCSAIVLTAFAVFALANYLGIHAEKPNPEISEQSTPLPANTPVRLSFPKTYFGKWQDKSGNFIVVREDGKADFHLEDIDVSGGILKIDEKKKTLKISSVFGDAQQWRIDRAPQTSNGKTSIILNKTEFQRAP